MNINITKSSKLGVEGGKWLKTLVDASIQKDRNYFRIMKDMRMLLNGEHWKVLKKQSREQVKMVINLAHAHVRSLAPTLFFRDPSVDTVPTAPQHAGKEKTWNSVINNTLEKTGFADVAKEVVFDAVLYPEGVMKDMVNKPLSTNEEEKKPTVESSEAGPTVWLDKGAPLNSRVSPNQLVVDYQAKSRELKNARFIVLRYKRNLHELKMSPLYGKNIELSGDETGENLSTGNAVGNTTEDYEAGWDDRFDGVNTDTKEEQVTIYEVWVYQLASTDKKFQLKQQMCVLLEGQDKPIRELADWDAPTVMGKGFNRYPVTRLVYNPVPDDVPVGELQVWKSMQIAMNWLISRITALVENDRQITWADPNKIKNYKKFREAFFRGDQRVLAEVDGDNAAGIIQPTFVGRDNYSLANMLQQFIQQVTGLGQNRRGGSGIRTATEASLVDQGTQIKTDEKVDTTSKFLKEVIEKKAILIRSLTQESGSNEWVFRVGGDVGSVNWLTFTPFELDWLPDIRIRVNSFRKMDSVQEMQKIASIVQMAVQLVSVLGPTVRVDILFARMLEAAGIHDSSKIIGDQDAEMMLQTIEIAGILTGVPAPVLAVHNHGGHMQVIDAFVGSQYGQQILAQEPAAFDQLMQHRQEHEQALIEAQQSAQSSQGDPFSRAGQGNPNEQSAAGQATSQDRLSTQQVPGGTGEFA